MKLPTSKIHSIDDVVSLIFLQSSPAIYVIKENLSDCFFFAILVYAPVFVFKLIHFNFHSITNNLSPKKIPLLPYEKNNLHSFLDRLWFYLHGTGQF